MTHWRQHLNRAFSLTAILVPILLVTNALFAPAAHSRTLVVLYIAPFAFGFLLWIAHRVRDAWKTLDTGMILDGVVVVLSAVRLLGPVVPTSGHMFFFVYSLLTTPGTRYRIITLVLIAETTYLKLLVWNDHASWGLGTLAGLALGIAYLAWKRGRENQCGQSLEGK